MSTRDLIDAIESGNSVEIQTTFEQAMAERIVAKLDDLRVQVAKNMFNESVDTLDEEIVEDEKE